MKRRIDTVDARSKLAARTAPYWTRLESGCSLGFRKTTTTSQGTWLARVYDATSRKDTWRSLGNFENLPAHERYSAAKKAAEALAGHLDMGGRADSMTLSECCAEYVKHLRAEGKDSTATDTEARFKRWIDVDKIARVDVRKLAAHHLRTWRQSIIKTKVILNPHADEADHKTRERSPASVNRDMTALRAALNHALDGGIVTTDAAWRVALRPIPSADKRRTTYLDRAQRMKLIDHAETALAVFIKGLALLPLRPGALAALTVSDFDKRTSALRIGTDKAGEGRTIKLPMQTAEFIAGLCKDKLPAASIFTRDGGKAWGKDYWKKDLKAAAVAAGLPPATTAYTLRHSVITDLVADGLDVLTVARLSGTSIAMIEKHYGHLRADHAAAALAKLAV